MYNYLKIIIEGEKAMQLSEKYNDSIKLSYHYGYRMLVHLKNVIASYDKLQDADELTKEVYRDSIVKKYETLEDITWKLLSKIFKSYGLDINSPRGCYKQAFKEGYINDIDIWNNILLSRNSTSHVYDERDYEEIKKKIVNQYIFAIQDLYKKLSSEVIN